MKTKGARKPKTNPEVFTVSAEPASEPAREEPAETSNTTPSRIAIPLRNDGSIDLDSMRESTKEKLRAAIGATPGMGSGGSAPAQVAVFPPQMVFALYGAMGAAESLVAQRVGKVPREIADRVFTYSPQEMELLVPPTSRVLQKYAAEWMIKYQDEIALAVLLTSVTMAKVNACIMLQKASQANSPEIPKKDGVEEGIKPN
jgi:hypothetical protein